MGHNIFAYSHGMVWVTMLVICGMLFSIRQFLILLMILELLTLICLQLFCSSVNPHTMVFILVLGVAEAAVGLSIFIWLSRSMGGSKLYVFFS